MKITFPDLPPIGLAVCLDSQRFDLVAVEPHRKLDGTDTRLLVWRSECATCGAGFTSRSPSYSLPQSRRCEQHRAPGKKVK